MNSNPLPEAEDGLLTNNYYKLFKELMKLDRFLLAVVLLDRLKIWSSWFEAQSCSLRTSFHLLSDVRLLRTVMQRLVLRVVNVADKQGPAVCVRPVLKPVTFGWLRRRFVFWKDRPRGVLLLWTVHE